MRKDDTDERTTCVVVFHYISLSPFRSIPADLVVWPQTKEQVSKIVSICDQEQISIVPFGAASGLEGGVNAINVSFHTLHTLDSLFPTISWYILLSVNFHLIN